MNWTRIPVPMFLRDYADAWDELNRRLYRGHPLFDSRFVFTLIRHYPSAALRAYALGPLDSPRALVLLEPHRIGLWRVFQRSQAEVVPALLAAGDVLALPSLMRTIAPYTMSVDFLRQDPSFCPWPGERPSPLTIQAPHARTAAVSRSGSFESYWGGRPRGLRQNIARSARNASARFGPLQLQVVEGPGEMRHAVREFGEMESRSWKAAEGTAISPSNAQGHFYQDVFEQFAMTGQATVYALRAGDAVVARQLALANADMCITLKTTYDAEFAAISPGRLLDHEMLRLEFERKRYQSVEFYTKADALQLQWATDSRVISHVTCFRSRFARAAYRLIRDNQGRWRPH